MGGVLNDWKLSDVSRDGSVDCKNIKLLGSWLLASHPAFSFAPFFLSFPPAARLSDCRYKI